MRRTLGSEWGDSDDQGIVGCVGSLKPGKGLLMLVDVSEVLRDRRPELRHVFIGDGPLMDERDARRCHIALDIAAQASDSEGRPNAVFEAAVASPAIVATDVGATRSQDGYTLPKPPRR